MRSILSFLGVKDVSHETGSETIRRIATGLDRLPLDRARYIAAFAFTLSRIAYADRDVTDDETARMESLVREKGQLPEEQAALVVQMAKSQQVLFGGTDDFLVTRELDRAASYDDKVALIECLFAVAAADGAITTTEANEIARTARELKVEQSDLSRLRSAYRDYLAVRQVDRTGGS
jgi:uncharacterized tellurite resistance protein B-like protein